MNESNKTIVVFVSDLIFRTKIASTIATLGGHAATVRTLDDFRVSLAAQQPALVLIDLNAAGGVDAVACAAHMPVGQSPDKKLAGSGRAYRILAYVSHVDTEIAEQARRHGADDVMPRSRFSTELPEMVRAALQGEWRP